MKSLIFLTVFVVFTQAALDPELVAQIRDKMRDIAASCAKEVGASEDDLATTLAHKIPESHEGKCITFCIHKTYNAQNEDGSLNMAGALSNLEIVKDVDADIYEKATKVFKSCESTPVDSDPCVFATSLVQCVVKESKAVNLDDIMVQ